MSNFRRKLIEASEKHNNIFSDAYFYVPFKEGQTVVDVNHGISPSVNTGSLMSDGYYTNGNSGQELKYTDTNLCSVIDEDHSVYFEITPYSVSRNMYIFEEYILEPKLAHRLGIFIYYVKNNKFGFSIVNKDITGYLIDDEIDISPIINYGNNYKIAFTWKVDSLLKVYIDGICKSYNFSKCIGTPAFLSIGKHGAADIRDAKATYKTIAIWDKILTEEECINLTI